MNGLALCAGAGGLELGISLALGESYRTVCYVEWEAYATATLVARMENSSLDKAPVWDNVKTFDGKPWRGKVDIITAGYPCQPFSFAGQRKGKEDPRHLWPSVARIVREIQPEWIFLENVAGHVQLGLADVLSDLNEMGLSVQWGCLSAGALGASHKRERLFILAHSCRGSDSTGKLQRGKHIDSKEKGTTNSYNGIRKKLGNTTHPQYKGAHNKGNKGSLQGGGELVNPDGIRRWGKGDTKQPPSGIDRRGLPIWPPRPSDAEGWGKVIQSDPTLKPAICGMADGMAHRVDRLRLCGNGVVPVVAAVAFLALRKRISGG